MFSPVDDGDEAVLCYQVVDEDGGLLMNVPLIAKPLPTAAKRRLSLPQPLLTREQLQPFFDMAQVASLPFNTLFVTLWHCG